EANSAELLYNEAVDLLKNGRTAEGIQRLEAALRIKPNYAEAHNNLGVVLAQMNRMPEAITHFEEALRNEPNYADAHYNLGLALSQMPGRRAEANAHLETAKRLRN